MFRSKLSGLIDYSEHLYFFYWRYLYVYFFSNLKEAARPFHMIIDNVALTHLTFGTDYTNAIEAKQIALQQAEQAKYLVKQAEQDKLSTVIKAEVPSLALTNKSTPACCFFLLNIVSFLG